MLAEHAGAFEALDDALDVPVFNAAGDERTGTVSANSSQQKR